MVKIIIRLFLLAACTATLAYSFGGERYAVFSFSKEQPDILGGHRFVKIIEDGMLMRERGGKLYNAETLIPQAAQSNDCPT